MKRIFYFLFVVLSFIALLSCDNVENVDDVDRNTIEIEDYFIDEMNTTIQTVDTLINENTFVMPVVTDIHYNSKTSIKETSIV